MLRRLFRLLVVLSVVAILGVIAVWLLTNTDVGRERSRRFVLGILQGQTHGIVKVEQMHGNLLSGATLTRVSITDSAGNPFLQADSISLRYEVSNFFSKRLDFSDVVLYHPDVVVARLPNGPWNYRTLWPAGPKRAPGDSTVTWGDIVRLTNVTVLSANVTVRSPWAPREGVSARVRDSIITDALSAGSRLYINRAPGGFQKVVTLERVNARAPFVRWADPAFKTRFLEIAALAMDAFPFRPPAAKVVGLTGQFDFNDDSLWWKGANARLPHSNMTGDGVYNMNSGDMVLAMRASPATFDDFKWLYPHFPLEGGGSLRLGVTWKGATQDYVIRDADLETGTAHVLGDVGVTLVDTIFFHDANLRFTGVTTKQIEDLKPGLQLPRQGVLAGRAKFAGTFKRMRLAGADITFDAYNRGTSHVMADGIIGFAGTQKVVVSARDLHVRVEPLTIDLVKLIFPTVPVGGTLSGVATLNGSGADQLHFTGIDIIHRDGGNVSHAVGTASSHTTGRPTLTLDINAQPVALAELTKFAPTLPFKGFATGPIRGHGPIDDMTIDTRMTLTGGGELAIRGQVDFLSKDLGYDVVMETSALDLSKVMINGPVSALNSSGIARGRGFKPATMYSDVAMTLVNSSVDTIGVDTISVRARIAQGIANIDTARIVGSGAQIEISGQIGWDSLKTGTLAYSAQIDSLGTFARYIPGANTVDTTVVKPRPRVAFEALVRARADSARTARQTEVERAVAMAPPVTLRVPTDTPRAIPRNVLAGRVHASGTITGSVDHFSLDGTTADTGLVVLGNSAQHITATYKWIDARTKQSKVSLDLDADTVSAYGFAFDKLHTDATYSAPNGTVNLTVQQGSLRSYGLNGDFTLDKERNELHLKDVALKFDSTTWSSTHASTVRFGAGGIEVVNLELLDGPGRRIYANGLLPTKGVANFDLQVTDFAVENVAELLQSDLPVAGRVSLNTHVSGTSEDPRIKGSLDFVKGTYNEVGVPELHGTFDYAAKQLTLNARAVDTTGRVVASVNGTVPVDLALSGVTGSRLQDLPLNVAVASDSLPIELIPQFTNKITDIKGSVIGNVKVAGTLKKPQLQGDLTLSAVSFNIVPTGTRLESVNGRVRMTGDTVFVDSIAGFSGAGPVRLGGYVAIGDWREPVFNIALTAEDANLLNNDKGEVHATAGLRLSGTMAAPYVSGQLTVVHGVVYVSESRGKKLIGAGDPSLFAVVDTSIAFQRNLFPAQSRMFTNMRVDVDVAVNRDTWVRSRDANVEIYTDGPLQIHALGDALTLTGAVNADRGEYTFLSKRFQIKRGSALFIGDAALNPTLQVTAEYQVKQQNVTNIRVLIGGTLTNTRISLESDAQPPLSQSDLLSYLAFGEGSASLLQFNQGSLGGQQGNLLSVASSRLAGVALGVALDEVKGSAARSLGVDVFNITPGDIPFSQGSGFDSFLKGTEIEAGRYLNPNTFVSVIATPGILACGRRQENSSCNILGASFVQRTSKGLRFEATLSPRYIPDAPTLAGQKYGGTSQFGAFIIREWRF